jgi:hypothetical protein
MPTRFDHRSSAQEASQSQDGERAGGRIYAPADVYVHNGKLARYQPIEERPFPPQAPDCHPITRRIEPSRQFHRLGFGSPQHERVEQEKDPSLAALGFDLLWGSNRVRSAPQGRFGSLHHRGNLLKFGLMMCNSLSNILLCKQPPEFPIVIQELMEILVPDCGVLRALRNLGLRKFRIF